MQGLEEPGGHVLCLGMAGLFEDTGEVLHRGRRGCLRGRIGLQEVQGGALLQFGKQRERHRIVGFEAGGQLVRPAGSASGSDYPGRA